MDSRTDIGSVDIDALRNQFLHRRQIAIQRRIDQLRLFRVRAGCGRCTAACVAVAVAVAVAARARARVRA